MILGMSFMVVRRELRKYFLNILPKAEPQVSNKLGRAYGKKFILPLTFARAFVIKFDFTKVIFCTLKLAFISRHNSSRMTRSIPMRVSSRFFPVKAVYLWVRTINVAFSQPTTAVIWFNVETKQEMINASQFQLLPSQRTHELISTKWIILCSNQRVKLSLTLSIHVR